MLIYAYAYAHIRICVWIDRHKQALKNFSKSEMYSITEWLGQYIVCNELYMHICVYTYIKIIYITGTLQDEYELANAITR